MPYSASLAWNAWLAYWLPRSVELGRVAEVFQFHQVGFRHHPGEGGMDADLLNVGDDQERGILQGGGVELELLERLLQASARALEPRRFLRRPGIVSQTDMACSESCR